MRKRIIERPAAMGPPGRPWLDLERLAQVELTSEDAAYPIELAIAGDDGGWRAGLPGPQTIRLFFDHPQHVQRIHLEFCEADRPRTQEFVLRWFSEGAASSREIVRQQYTFAPPNTTAEVEDYTVDLDGMSVLELNIFPDISGSDARACMKQLRLG